MEDAQRKMRELLRDAKRYRDQAEELRLAAQQLTTENCVLMLKIADDYDVMAKTLEGIEETMRAMDRLQAPRKPSNRNSTGSI